MNLQFSSARYIDHLDRIDLFCTKWFLCFFTAVIPLFFLTKSSWIPFDHFPPLYTKQISIHCSTNEFNLISFGTEEKSLHCLLPECDFDIFRWSDFLLCHSKDSISISTKRREGDRYIVLLHQNDFRDQKIR